MSSGMRLNREAPLGSAGRWPAYTARSLSTSISAPSSRSLSRASDTGGGGCGGASPPRNAITDRTAVRAPRGRPPIMSEAASPDATAVHSALLPSDRLGLPLAYWWSVLAVRDCGRCGDRRTPCALDHHCASGGRAKSVRARHRRRRIRFAFCCTIASRFVLGRADEPRRNPRKIAHHC